MKRLALSLAIALSPLAAFAQSATDPVDRIMNIAKARWENTEGASADYFDGLDEDFSEAFAVAYREAAKYPAYEDGYSPFDYDVITASQDGCPLKNVTMSPTGDKNGISVIAVKFKLWTCAPDAESQARVNELKFDVITENGKPVISDIHRLSEGKWDTLVGEMKQQAEDGKKAQQQ